MDVGILGPLRLTIDDAPVEVPPGRQRALLAALAVEAGRVVSADGLVEVVWGDRLPANPANALQGRISQLRKLVGAERVVQQGTGYLLDVTAQQVDARRFEALVDRAHDLLVADRPGEALAVLQNALALWRGDALEEFADEPWARLEASRLEERRRTAEGDLFDAELARGRHTTVIPDLERAVAESPLSERLRGQLMVALYRAGRQADALALFANTRRLLDDELGLDPGPELRAIHESVLRQDRRLEAPTEAVPPASRTNLPNPTSSFVGRDTAVGQVRTLSQRSRIVTLTGPGGAGKTRLALEAARGIVERHGDGAWLVELATIRTSDELVSSVSETLRLAGDGAVMADAPTGMRRLVDALRPRQLLLLLDNCEHLVDQAGTFISELLAGCPEVRVLATSREPLGVRGEVTSSVPSLAVPLTDVASEVDRSPAVALLVDRIGTHRPDLELGPRDRETVAEISRRLDGLPLALELAAARTRALSLQEIAEGLDDRFALLTSGPRDVLPRQRTLRAVIDWSWELLDDSQRRAWASLAVFATAFTVADARRVLPAVGLEGGRTADILTDLVNRSILSAATGQAPTRYRMLETIREYGLARSNELGLVDEVSEAHSNLVIERADLVYPTDPDVWTLDMAEASQLMDEARAVLHRSRQQGDHEVVQRLAGSFGWVWWLRGRRDEGLDWLVWALEGGGVEPRAGLTACRLAIDLDDPPAEMISWADDAAARAQDPIDHTMAVAWGALARIRRGAFREAHRQLAAADTEHAATQWPAATITLVRAIAWAVQGELDRAMHGAKQAQKGYAASGAWPGEMYTADMLAAIREAQGDNDGARELRERTLDLARRHDAHEVEAVQLTRIGNLALAAGNASSARSHHEAALAISERLGIRWLQVDAANGAGTAARLLEDLDAAHDRHALATAVAQQVRHHLGTAMAQAGLGFVAEQRGKPDAALAHHHRALVDGEASGLLPPVILATIGLAAATLASSAEHAARLLGAATTLRHASTGRQLEPTAAMRAGVPLPDFGQADFDRVERATRNVLGQAFDRHFEHGRTTDVRTLLDDVGLPTP